jgi:hypothetical protein
MKNVEPKIIWEAFIDPFGENVDEYEPNAIKNAFNGDDNPDETEIAWSDSYSDDPSFVPLQQKPHMSIKKPLKVLFTSNGIFPLLEQSLPSKIFNFWVAHTNFNISEHIKQVVEETEGIETLEILSRYRMRVGIGKCFDSLETKSEITKRVFEAIGYTPKRKKVPKNPQKTD